MKNTGKNWENSLAKLFAENPDTTTIVKTSAPASIISWKGEGRFLGVFRDKGTCDFEGCFYGKHVSIDAKSTNNRKAWTISNIKKHQLERITEVYYSGGLSGIALAWHLVPGQLHRAYGLGAKSIIAELEAGKKSISMTRCEELCHKSINDCTKLDLTPGAIRRFLLILAASSFTRKASGNGDI